MKKRIFSAILAATVVFCMMPIQVRASEPTYIITNSTPEDSKTANNGYITIDKTSATSGTTVTVTVVPSEGYELESLTATPAAPTISTIADVLNTIEVFPASDDQNTPSANAWVADVQDNKQSYAYTYTNQSAGITVLLLKIVGGGYAYFPITDEVTEGENCYTVSYSYSNPPRTRTLTFNMVNGILTSLMYEDEGSETYDGTYVPASTPSARLQPITPVKQTDGTYQFTMPACNVSVKAKFKSTTPAPDPQGNYLDSLDDMFEAAITSGNTDTIYWDEGDALPNYIMKLLYENPSLSLDFKYTYEGIEHEIYIGPGQATNDDIEWYGPLWLLEKYGEKKDTPAIHGTYTIVKGDTLNELAVKFNTTVDELMRLNPYIEDKNILYPGSKLNY